MARTAADLPSYDDRVGWVRVDGVLGPDAAALQISFAARLSR